MFKTTFYGEEIELNSHEHPVFQLTCVKLTFGQQYIYEIKYCKETADYRYYSRITGNRLCQHFQEVDSCATCCLNEVSEKIQNDVAKMLKFFCRILPKMTWKKC